MIVSCVINLRSKTASLMVFTHWPEIARVTLNVSVDSMATVQQI